MGNSIPDKQDEDLPGMLAVAKGIAEQRWPHTMDAAVWAAEFVKLHPDADEGSMLGWFANAIMAGYDTAQQRAAPSAIEAPRYVGGFCDDREQCLADKKRLRALIPGCDCAVPTQCWEECGTLGHSEKHVQIAPDEDSQ